MFRRLFEDLKVAEIDGARQSEGDQAGRNSCQTPAPLAWFVATVGGNPEVSSSSSARRCLRTPEWDDGLEFAAVFLPQRYEAERLLRIADGIEEFSPGQDRARTEQKHHFYLGTLRQRTWEREQAASQGNHLKFSGDTAAAIKAKHDGSVVFQMNARSTRNRVTMGEGAHIQARSMALGNHEKKVTEGACPGRFSGHGREEEPQIES